MKKFLAMALALLMVAVLLPVTAMAETVTEVKTVEELKSALKDGRTSIALGADIDLTNSGGSEQVTVLHDTTIDLNGHTLNGSIWSGDYSCTADGTRLTLVDSAGDGQIYSKFCFGDGGAMMQANAVTAWQHAVTINGGTYQSNNVAIVCQVQNTNAAEGVIINGGTIKGSGDLIEGVSLPGPVGGCLEAVIGTVTINGGTFEAAQYGSVIIAKSGNSNCDTVININGGTFSGACMFDFGKDHSSKSIVNVYGGDFTVKSPDGSALAATQFAYDNVTGAALVNNDMFKLNIMGGTFNVDPSAYVAEGYAVAHTNGKYVVAELAGAGGTTQIEVSKIEENTGVTIPAAAQGDAAIKVELKDSTVVFDNEAVKAIKNGTNSADVDLKVKSAPAEALDISNIVLTDTQKAAIAQESNAVVVELTLEKGGNKVCTAEGDGFGAGKATITIPYSGANASTKVYYVKENGQLEQMTVKGYTDSTVTFETSHFSHYVITTPTGAGSITIIVPGDTTDTTTTTETTNNPATGMNDFVGAAVALAVISVIGAAAVVRKK